MRTVPKPAPTDPIHAAIGNSAITVEVWQDLVCWAVPAHPEAMRFSAPERTITAARRLSANGSPVTIRKGTDPDYPIRVEHPRHVTMTRIEHLADVLERDVDAHA